MSTILNIVNLQTLAMKPMTTMQVQGQCFVVKAATVAQQMQAKKPLKRLNSSKDPEALRCKRRIDFTGLSYTLPKEQPATVARRNQRERNRVKLVNLGFETLREHVPQENKTKKMSKVDTLRSAVEYIRNLQGILEDNDTINAAFNSDVSMSPVDSLAHSPTQSLSSESSWGPLSAEEEDLLDFANWF